MRLQKARVLSLLLLGTLSTRCVTSGVVVNPPREADLVVISKGQRTLSLLRKNQELKTYKVTFGRSSGGRKTCQGDNRTPEGRYEIDYRLSEGESDNHLALHVSYPNAEDIARAKQSGCAPGGDIMIRGIHNGFGWLGPLHRLFNWTSGCIAVTNSEIEEIARSVSNGTPVVIRP